MTQDNTITLPTNIMVVHPDKVLDAAKGLKKVVVIGVDETDWLYVASSHYEPETALLLMRGQNFLMKLLGDNE